MLLVKNKTIRIKEPAFLRFLDMQKSVICETALPRNTIGGYVTCICQIQQGQHVGSVSMKFHVLLA